MVECNLAKVDVEGSNPFSRSKLRALRTVNARFLMSGGFGASTSTDNNGGADHIEAGSGVFGPHTKRV